ncbi:3-octaprenyl-4-hydroxybenzoate carboxy-lyase [Legionella lansingensis]|uniref:Flavin prenyltransferase UbiX n=1 Tax=Legionella lansingensis TaxID=45067 RepID=A0A0W0VTS4_9GAMM|nr:UbiX family flavin prenyltransferase [Legionella lansingensis]KTD23559.1 3-octaprenyl-4-hydroxybenzoate carboxy-lyase [Legionella lansingensis]SNV52236.1 3-octaprenyl-4-hydroxybenzoate carboxy-lyase [Legionella lansingensis]
MKKKRIIVGISGASGIVYGIRLLELLAETEYETHLIVSKAAQQTRSYETTLSAHELSALADVSYHVNDIAASIASGSFKTTGMIIAPCSMRTLASIANGITSNLLTRAADVVLKERRKLILLVRETPFHLGHIENMKKVTEMGAIVAPPVPAFYNHPQTIEDIVTHTVGRVLDLFDIDLDVINRWEK